MADTSARVRTLAEQIIALTPASVPGGPPVPPHAVNNEDIHAPQPPPPPSELVAPPSSPPPPPPPDTDDHLPAEVHDHLPAEEEVEPEAEPEAEPEMQQEYPAASESIVPDVEMARPLEPHEIEQQMPEMPEQQPSWDERLDEGAVRAGDEDAMMHEADTGYGHRRYRQYAGRGHAITRFRC